MLIFLCQLSYRSCFIYWGLIKRHILKVNQNKHVYLSKKLHPHNHWTTEAQSLNKITGVQEVNISEVWLDLLINSVKWSERERESEWTEQEKKALKTISCDLGNVQKIQRFIFFCLFPSCSLPLLLIWMHIHSTCRSLVFPPQFSFLYTIAPNLSSPVSPRIAGSITWCWFGSGGAVWFCSPFLGCDG